MGTYEGTFFAYLYCHGGEKAQHGGLVYFHDNTHTAPILLLGRVAVEL